MTTEPNWIQYITAVGSIATPLLVIALGAIGWKFRAEYERRLNLENQMRDERTAIYLDILEPFIIMFMSEAAWKSDPKNKSRDRFDVGIRKALSLDYKRRSFELILIGSDEVVTAYNNMMQFLFQNADNPTDTEKANQLLGFVADLLLEIRRSMGNDQTELDKWATMEWFITDIQQYRD